MFTLLTRKANNNSIIKAVLDAGTLIFALQRQLFLIFLLSVV
jgi:hypothetical protein